MSCDLESFNIDDFESISMDVDFDNILDADPNAQNEDGQTVLHAYVWIDRFDRKIMERVIRNGANLELRNRNGKTAFLTAVVFRHKGVMETLIENGADVNVQDNMGNNALHYMALPQLNDHWGYIVQNNLFIRPDYVNYDTTCFRDISSIFERLLKEGVDVNAMNQHGETPLMWAARARYLDMVKWLLASGANVNLRNEQLETCLHLASVFTFDNPLNANLDDALDANLDDGLDARRRDEKDRAVLSELVRNKACVNCFDITGCTVVDRIRFHRHENFLYFARGLVKVAVLVNWRRRIDFHLLRGPFPVDDEQDLEIIIYANECYDEIHWMKKFELPGGSYLCQFARRRVSEVEMNKKFEINDEVLEILLRHRFPIYHDFFLSRFQTYYLRRKASDLLIYTRDENRTLFLDHYTIFGPLYYF